jgi:hypothetical protein
MITAVSPPGTGAVDVTVTTGAGTSATGAADQYLYTLGPKLTPSDESDQGAFGASVALSSNGRTALIGAPGENGRGAARVFTRSGRVWTQQGGELTPSDASREGLLGWSVALSADGSTALIGGPADNNGHGEAWVFTRAGGAWTEQAAIINPSGVPVGIKGFFGWNVALSADGSTALIGDPLDGNRRGSAWVFTRSGGTWTQQGTIITPSDVRANGFFGWSVALSANGSTALIGAPENLGFGFGTAWVFTRSGATWTQQGEELNPSNVSIEREFGSSVALSANGGTALVGARSNNHGKGAAWVFTRSGAAWIQEGEPLNLSATVSPFFGPSVALSANGSTALLAEGGSNHGNGGAWVFTHSGAAWTQQGEGLNPSDESLEAGFGGEIGRSLALSANGGTALVGAPGDRGELGAEAPPTWPWSGYGAAWVFTRSGSSWGP